MFSFYCFLIPIPKDRDMPGYSVARWPGPGMPCARMLVEEKEIKSIDLALLASVFSVLFRQWQFSVSVMAAPAFLPSFPPPRTLLIIPSFPAALKSPSHGLQTLNSTDFALLTILTVSPMSKTLISRRSSVSTLKTLALLQSH